ncbi:ATP-binding cassette domain-containing protein [Tumebacillus permanentifrigoris]|uniref:ABC-2 type transport system ATP-binding protein n=1 Tax=Tumebacillus permanentifrigoris TaxID=378543 RepID=A0A316D956_9BACL|nr:ABC transporter ATP-binding protein [Tumebacillus permanentifrigoris]PWK07891.1 ABC-2 type transport system ATP-binding protein [Tumebacillus permanentifrigoris]
MISIQNLEFGYKEKKKILKRNSENRPPILRNISLDFQRGELYGLVGPNGCGKTTLAKLIMGIYEPSKGQIIIDGKKRPNLHDGQWKRRIGNVSGASSRLFSTMTLGEHVAMYSAIYDRFDDKWFREKLVEFRIDDKLKRWASSLSFGERIKFELALTLACLPEILILDEPTVGLDPAAILQIRKMVNNYLELHNACGIMTSHNLKDLTTTCVRGGFLQDGYITNEYLSAEIDADELERRYLEVF